MNKIELSEGLSVDKSELIRLARSDFSTFLKTLLADAQLSRFQKMQRLMILAREESQEGLIRRMINCFELNCRSIAEMAYQATCECLAEVNTLDPERRKSLLEEAKCYLGFGEALFTALQERQSEKILTIQKKGERYLAELNKNNKSAAAYFKGRWPLPDTIAPANWQTTRDVLNRNWSILQAEFKRQDTIFTAVGPQTLQNFAPLVEAFNKLFPVVQETQHSCRALIEDHYMSLSDETSRHLGEAIRYYLGSLSDSGSLAFPQEGAAALKLVALLERDTPSDRGSANDKANRRRWNKRPKRLLMAFDDPTRLYIMLLEAVPSERRMRVIKDFNTKLASLNEIAEESAVGDFNAEKFKALVTSREIQQEALLKLVDFSDFLLLYEAADAPQSKEDIGNVARCYELYSVSCPFLKGLRAAIETYRAAQVTRSRGFFAALAPSKPDDDAQLVAAKKLLGNAENWILNPDFIKDIVASFFESPNTPQTPGSFAWCLMEQLAPALNMDIATARAESLSDKGIFEHFKREFSETYFSTTSENIY